MVLLRGGGQKSFLCRADTTVAFSLYLSLSPPSYRRRFYGPVTRRETDAPGSRAYGSVSPNEPYLSRADPIRRVASRTIFAVTRLCGR